jgi:hypothetical protein
MESRRSRAPGTRPSWPTTGLHLHYRGSFGDPPYRQNHPEDAGFAELVSIDPAQIAHWGEVGLLDPAGTGALGELDLLRLPRDRAGRGLGHVAARVARAVPQIIGRTIGGAFGIRPCSTRSTSKTVPIVESVGRLQLQP